MLKNYLQSNSHLYKYRDYINSVIAHIVLFILLILFTTFNFFSFSGFKKDDIKNDIQIELFSATNSGEITREETTTTQEVEQKKPEDKLIGTQEAVEQSSIDETKKLTASDGIENAPDDKTDQGSVATRTEETTQGNLNTEQTDVRTEVIDTDNEPEPQSERDIFYKKFQAPIPLEKVKMAKRPNFPKEQDIQKQRDGNSGKNETLAANVKRGDAEQSSIISMLHQHFIQDIRITSRARDNQHVTFRIKVSGDGKVTQYELVSKNNASDAFIRQVERGFLGPASQNLPMPPNGFIDGETFDIQYK